ncbi:MAG: hypothetical protein HYZ53_04020 [Planctomycetes bacterium]|nr:hypothetical protein [Planctomycetota bacterium]
MPASPKKSAADSSNPDIRDIALSIFDKVRAIKRANPEVAKAVDRAEKEIRLKLVDIRTHIDRLEKKEDRELVTVLVINGLHRTADEVLVD